MNALDVAHDAVHKQVEFTNDSEVFRLRDLEKCQEVCRQRLNVAKDELKLKIKHWKPQWYKVAVEWIDLIDIELDLPPLSGKTLDSDDNEIVSALIRFPQGKKYNDQTKEYAGWNLSILVSAIVSDSSTTTSTATAVVHLNIIFDSSVHSMSSGRKIPVEQFEKYREAVELENIPINLHGDLIFYLMNAFGNNHSNNNIDGRYWHNGLAKQFENCVYFEDCHLFPGYFQFYSVKPENGENSKSGWARGGLWDEIIIGGKLLSQNFLRNCLIDLLCEYQVKQLVSHYFRWQKKKLLDTANKFVNSLGFWSNRDVAFLNGTIVPIDAIYGDVPTYKSYTVVANEIKLIQLTCLKNASLDEKVDVKINVTATSQSLHYVSLWEQAVKENSNIRDLAGDLTTTDIEWILSAFIQVKWIGETVRDTITRSSSQFPTVHDRFDSFDPLNLRGILAKTAPNLRLLSHVQNIHSLREEAASSTSSARVPTAVVDLIESYLPI